MSLPQHKMQMPVWGYECLVNKPRPAHRLQHPPLFPLLPPCRPLRVCRLLCIALCIAKHILQNTRLLFLCCLERSIKFAQHLLESLPHLPRVCSIWWLLFDVQLSLPRNELPPYLNRTKARRCRIDYSRLASAQLPYHFKHHTDTILSAFSHRILPAGLGKCSRCQT